MVKEESLKMTFKLRLKIQHFRQRVTYKKLQGEEIGVSEQPEKRPLSSSIVIKGMMA